MFLQLPFVDPQTTLCRKPYDAIGDGVGKGVDGEDVGLADGIELGLAVGFSVVGL